MPTPTTESQLRGLILSAVDLQTAGIFPPWFIEDYLNILENLVLLSNTVDETTDFVSPTFISETIAGGEITITGTANRRIITVDGTGASTDLNTINGGNAGEEIILQCASNARNIVIKDGTSLRISSDNTLNNTQDKIMLLCISSGVFDQLSRSSNA